MDVGRGGNPFDRRWDLGGDRDWIRFLDSDDRRYVVFEFDAGFDILSEMRADSLEWEGDDFFFSRIWAG